MTLADVFINFQLAVRMFYIKASKLFNELKSNYLLKKIIVGRKVLIPYFKKTPPTLATPFSNSIQPPPPPPSLSPPNRTPTALSVALPLLLNG